MTYTTNRRKNHHLKEPQEPQEKDNNRVIFKMQSNEQINMQEDVFNENYESVEDRETAI